MILILIFYLNYLYLPTTLLPTPEGLQRFRCLPTPDQTLDPPHGKHGEALVDPEVLKVFVGHLGGNSL